ncbi:uncharacterized protein PG986_008003 [Apiospora aurea]|uniref:Uncharacterized protein n=1 Tax=Apiospora aurea TaxID=335848 RepID=A0ABR1QFM1_9PEZI
MVLLATENAPYILPAAYFEFNLEGTGVGAMNNRPRRNLFFGVVACLHALFGSLAKHAQLMLSGATKFEDDH